MSIWAGPCLFTDISESQMILDTAMALQDIGVDYFRCKLWGGGTLPERYFPGMGVDGLDVMRKIKDTIKVGTEIQIPEQYESSWEWNEKEGVLPIFDYVWVGARNCFNYGLRWSIKICQIPWALKRGSNMTIEQLIGAHDTDKPTWVIERGIDSVASHMYTPDLKGVLRIKYERPDIFDKLIVDCSHSVFMKDLVGDVYGAFKSVGVKHFMFECTIDGKSKTDQSHMLSVKELETILKGA